MTAHIDILESIRPMSPELIQSLTTHVSTMWSVIRARLAGRELGHPELDRPLEIEADTHDWCQGVISGLVTCPLDGRKYRITVEFIREPAKAVA